MKYFAAALIFISSTANADCPAVSYLQEGKPASCTGYLFTPEKELEVRTKVANYDVMTDIVKKQDELIGTMQVRINDITSNNIKLTEALSSQKARDEYQNYAYFILGAVLAGLASYAAVQAYK